MLRRKCFPATTFLEKKKTQSSSPEAVPASGERWRKADGEDRENRSQSRYGIKSLFTLLANTSAGKVQPGGFSAPAKAREEASDNQSDTNLESEYPALRFQS